MTQRSGRVERLPLRPAMLHIGLDDPDGLGGFGVIGEAGRFLPQLATRKDKRSGDHEIFAR